VIRTIDALNRMTAGDFVAAFGDIAEHSPWVAERAATARPFAGRENVVDAFTGALRRASQAEQLAVLRAHPDLAGKAVVAGELTEDSKREQAGAGLDQLSGEEFERFTHLNQTYKERFGIPFIFAVKGATKDLILASFEERVGNDRAREIEIAIDNVCRILRFRLEDRIEG